MSELKIERGVPLPSSNTAGLSAILRKMKKGESVLVPFPLAKGIHPTARSVFGRAGTIVTRMEETGVRVWRLI